MSHSTSPTGFASDSLGENPRHSYNENYMSSQNFNFDLYVESKNSNGNIEAINITDCWIKGKFNLITLQSETDFTTEEYEASFLIENATFEDTIEDGNDWSSKTTTADNN